MSRRKDESARRALRDVCETWRGMPNAVCKCTYHCTSCDRIGDTGDCCSCCKVLP